MFFYTILYFHKDKLVDSYVFDNQKEANKQWAWVVYSTGQDDPENVKNRFSSDNGFGENDDDMWDWEFLFFKIHPYIGSMETPRPNITAEMTALVKEYG